MSRVTLLLALIIGLTYTTQLTARPDDLGGVEGITVRPLGSHTEIAAQIRGKADYRLFHRLVHPTDPRLTIVLSKASYRLEERSFDSIMRGGVRKIEVRELPGDTVQIRVGLIESSPYMIYERGDEVILRIENPDGEFTPWTTSRGYAETGPAPEPEPEPQLEPPTEPQSEPGPRGEPEIGVGPGAPAKPEGERTIGRRTILAMALTGLGALVLLITIRRRGDEGQGDRRTRPRVHRRRGASRVWAVRTLAEDGATVEESARKTGLSQDAIEMILESGRGADQRGRREGPPDPAEGAGSGTFCRPKNPYARILSERKERGN